MKGNVNPLYPDGCPRTDPHNLKNNSRRDDQNKKWDLVDKNSGCIFIIKPDKDSAGKRILIFLCKEIGPYYVLGKLITPIVSRDALC